MIGIFTRTPNGDGNMQWRCRNVMEGRVNHSSGYTEQHPSVAMTVNVKIKPSVGKFCKPPAYYM